MEMPITELKFTQPSIMLTNYTAFHHADPFVLTSFAISPRKIFNRPKKKTKKTLNIFSRSIVGEKGDRYNDIPNL